MSDAKWSLVEPGEVGLDPDRSPLEWCEHTSQDSFVEND